MLLIIRIQISSDEIWKVSIYISGEVFCHKESSMNLWGNWKYEVSLQKRRISILKGSASKIRRFRSENMRLPTLPLSHPNMNFESSKSSNPIIALWSHFESSYTLSKLYLGTWPSKFYPCWKVVKIEYGCFEAGGLVLDRHKCKVIS